MKKPYLVFAAVLVLCAPIGIAAKKKIPYDEMIRTTAKGQERIHITVGIIRKDSFSYAVYGKDGVEEKNSPAYEYEIGSITKTFTTSLLAKSLSEKKIKLDDTIDQYLHVGRQDHYPTILQLATHTSGYGQMNHAPILLNAMKCRNPLMAFNRADMIKLVDRKKLSGEDHGWEYSNFGMAVLGCAVSESFNSNYSELIDSYIKNDLNLQHTRVAHGKGDIAPYWEWNPDDVYIAAGGLVS
ncbi:MAG: serine hydrolase domain-containing protein, partial [Spirochaetota bacterium]